MLKAGVYEQVVNAALARELDSVEPARKALAPIDPAEAAEVLSQYLADVARRGLENVLDIGGDIAAQVELANRIVALIESSTQEADFASLGIDRRAEQLLALLRENDPRLAAGRTAEELERPETSLARSSLFTGAVHEPQMYTELKREIASADRIDMLVSFIKWSGLRLIMDALREFAERGGELRVITTSYMGATDVKAIEELSALPNTKIKVSYDTKRTRLHAKAYVFYRETGFTTAYVGSANLSNAAISSGLEWNVKVTRGDLPETMDKIEATFESYWNSGEFEYYTPGQRERLSRALKDANFGELFVGGSRPDSAEHIFMSIQTFNSQGFDAVTASDFYDYIVVDEFHHAAAPTYKRLLEHYRPKIMLGLTATPERMDGKSILDYFDGRIAAEIRLPEAIERRLLCPFQYFGVTDTVDLSRLRWSRGGYDKAELTNVYALSGAAAERRAEHVLRSLLKYVTDIDDVKGLGFCASVEHARFMCDFFNRRGVPALCLSGRSPEDERRSAKLRLVSGEVRFIFVVDIYNEGVDIPEVNT
ncbi:MAG TPA: DEAD/DEAH box helicase family protein, partial [Candidatus Scatomorpha stercoravium]|nr:DEAD/DEAH box helicase family protein [Candidatus Scatomorpha stercoravium]